MKRIISLLVCTLAIITFANCGNDKSKNKIPVKHTNAENSESQMESESGENEIIDLTLLSDTMVYGEVYTILMAPDDYIGKNIKIEGTCDIYEDDTTGKIYYACIVSDATACCFQGIEFKLSEDYAYTEQYPRLGEKICVEGKFDSYFEDGNTYYYLRDAQLAE